VKKSHLFNEIGVKSIVTTIKNYIIFDTGVQIHASFVMKLRHRATPERLVKGIDTRAVVPRTSGLVVSKMQRSSDQRDKVFNLCRRPGDAIIVRWLAWVWYRYRLIS